MNRSRFLWLGAAVLLAVIITWSAYWLKEESYHFAGSRTRDFFNRQWSVVSLPGYILADLLGIDVDVPYASGITFAGALLITVPNAIGLSGGTLVLLRILRRRALLENRNIHEPGSG